MCLATANLPASLTVNSLFPQSPRRTFFIACGLSPGTPSQVIRPTASPLRGRAKARSAALSSRGRGAKFQKPRSIPGLFIACGLSPETPPQVIRPTASPLRGHAKARSAALSSPGRGAKFQKPRSIPGFFLLPADSHQGPRPRLFGLRPHPFGAALKRVQLRYRVQVAGPDSKASASTGAFLLPAESHRGPHPRLFGLRPHPLGAALKRVQLRCRVQVVEPDSKATRVTDF